MGNCCVSQRITFPCCIKHNQNGEVVKIVKPDGKVMEFTKPVKVKDLLLHFTNSAIGSSQHGSAHLPPNSELKMGQVYYLISSPKSHLSSMEVSEKSSKASKRVRIVLTKAELKLLLAEQVSMEELVLQQLERGSLCSEVDQSSAAAAWKPVLAAIPEE